VRATLTAFALGAAATALFAVAVALGLSALADAAGRETFALGPGGFELVSFERTARGTATTFGPALAALPVLGGALNAAGAALLLRLRRGRSA
jgi:hypothetical protein